VTGNSEELLDRCQAFHDCGRSYGTFKGSGCFSRGTNCRMMHYAAALLRQEIDKLVTDTERRRENADRLTAGLKEIPGIQPARLPENSRAVWHLYAFRYDPAQFHGLPRGRFIRALGAEGIPCGGGYSEQYFDGLLDEAIASRGFQRLFSPQRLKAYRDSFQELKGNKLVCETTVGMYQSMLLADRSDMDHIVEAVRKIHAHSAALAQRA
jgi:dTDP-4-amino-4,6-dideoxygalactose transaminase